VAQATTYAVDQATEWLNALYVTNNRYITAVEAGDSTSANLQSTTFQGYISSYNTAIDVAKKDLGCLSGLLASAGIGTTTLTAQEETDALNSLATAPVDPLEKVFGSLGITTARIRNLIARIEAAPPPLPTETAVDALKAVVGALKPL
jgi:hypothetical protein